MPHAADFGAIADRDPAVLRVLIPVHMGAISSTVAALLHAAEGNVRTVIHGQIIDVNHASFDSACDG